MPLIKRYPNRKLYDTEAKRYVTLDDIAAMVRAEKEVRVMDNDSGEDVTSLTLTQIILEQEKKSAGYLPSALLTNLIRSGGSTIGQLRKSVQSSVAGVTSMGGLTELTRRRTQEIEAQVNSLFEQGKLNLEQAQSVLKLDSLVNDLLHSLNVPTHDDLRALQAQVELLAARLKELDESAAIEEAAPQATSASALSDAPAREP
jgi:polyhydroxyalkanoate synthesis repressor PhaR